MNIPFTEFFTRVRTASDIRTQMDLAAALGVNRSAVTQAKHRNSVPQKWILSLARRYTLSPDWLEFGTGDPYPAAASEAAIKALARSVPKPVDNAPLTAASGMSVQELAGAVSDMECVYVPKVTARLCAGAGSFEVDALPVDVMPFTRQWLSRMGSPSSMVFMDVSGDSMEPSIMDGDTVLVDQSNTALSPDSVFAVGVEDAIYLKRVEHQGSRITLRSDNTQHADIHLRGDELQNFRIIGRVVWLCRDCRRM